MCITKRAVKAICRHAIEPIVAPEQYCVKQYCVKMAIDLTV
jgi:hypothetical protein